MPLIVSYVVLHLKKISTFSLSVPTPGMYGPVSSPTYHYLRLLISRTVKFGCDVFQQTQNSRLF